MTDILTHLRNASRACTETYECALSINEVRQIVKLVDRAWQPIDTAPGDVAVLVYDSGLERPVVAQRMTAMEDGSVDWVYARQISIDNPVAFIARNPTHWMPLPPPPPPLSTPAEVDRFTQAMSEAPRQIGDQ